MRRLIARMPFADATCPLQGLAQLSAGVSKQPKSTPIENTVTFSPKIFSSLASNSGLATTRYRLSMNHRTKPGELERFRQLVKGMSRDSAVYKMLKQELGAMGYWKNRARGKPQGFK